MSAADRTVVKHDLVRGYEVVLGLEVHAQLATRSKIFSAASTAYGAEPNRQACLVDLGYPGVLPVLNAEVVRMAIAFGLSVGASIAPRSVFARKNYFYPDLPPLREMIAVLMPTRLPRRSMSAPPELPGLTAASVWTASP